MIQAWLAKKAAGIGVWLAVCAALGLALWVQTQRLESTRERADALGQRLVNADAQVKQANRGIDTCVIANRDTQRAIKVCAEDTQKLKERTAKLDADLAASRRQYMSAMAETEPEDAAAQRDPTLLPAAVHNEVVRKRGAGDIWR